MKVAQLRLQQDQKWLITSNCLHREADYPILRVSGLNCYLWAEFQWTLVLIKCIGCWYFHHAGVTFEEKARHLTLRESNLVTCSSQRGFMLVVSLIKIQDKINTPSLLWKGENTKYVLMPPLQTGIPSFGWF